MKTSVKIKSVNLSNATESGIYYDTVEDSNGESHPILIVDNRKCKSSDKPANAYLVAFLVDGGVVPDNFTLSIRKDGLLELLQISSKKSAKKSTKKSVKSTKTTGSKKKTVKKATKRG